MQIFVAFSVYIIMGLLVGPFVMICEDDEVTLNKNITLKEFSKDARMGGLLCAVAWPIVLPAMIIMGFFKAINPTIKFIVNRILRTYGWLYSEVKNPKDNI